MAADLAIVFSRLISLCQFVQPPCWVVLPPGVGAVLRTPTSQYRNRSFFLISPPLRRARFPAGKFGNLWFRRTRWPFTAIPSGSCIYPCIMAGCNSLSQLPLSPRGLPDHSGAPPADLIRWWPALRPKKYRVEEFGHVTGEYETFAMKTAGGGRP